MLCICQSLSVTVTNYLRKQLKMKKDLFENKHFRGFCPWCHGSISFCSMIKQEVQGTQLYSLWGSLYTESQRQSAQEQDILKQHTCRASPHPTKNNSEYPILLGSHQCMKLAFSWANYLLIRASGNQVFSISAI